MIKEKKRPHTRQGNSTTTRPTVKRVFFGSAEFSEILPFWKRKILEFANEGQYQIH